MKFSVLYRFSLVGHRFEVQQSSGNSCCAKKKKQQWLFVRRPISGEVLVFYKLFVPCWLTWRQRSNNSNFDGCTNILLYVYKYIYMWKMLTSRHRHHWEAFTCMRRRRSSWMVHCTQPTCWCVRTPVSPTCPSPGRSIQVGAHSAWGTNVIYYSKLFISPQWTMSHVQVRCMHRPLSVTHRFNLTEACMVCKFSEARLWSFLNDFFF